MAERVHQHGVEVLYTSDDTQARVHQHGVEALYEGEPLLRVTQTVLLVAYVEGGAPPPAGGSSYVTIIG